MALKGIKVIELVGLAPAPFCGLLLSDFGANVIRVDKVNTIQLDCLTRGKKSIAVDLKHPDGQRIVKRLCSTADVLIEPFRPGIMEKLNLGPEILTKENKRLIYARLSGYGQSGPLSKAAGHDLNYLAVSGILSLLGRKSEKPFPPINLLGDFAGGGLICALGICMALIERSNSNYGQVIDANIVEGTNYLSTFLHYSRKEENFVSNVIWPNIGKRGENVLDSGAPMYDVYRTKDDKFVALGAIEDKFFKSLTEKLGLNGNDYSLLNMEKFEELRNKLTEIFATKTQSEWIKLFDKEDETCFTPVVEFAESHKYEHNKRSFLDNQTPIPAPRLSRTPANPSLIEPDHDQNTKEILMDLGYKEEEIYDLKDQNVISLPKGNSKL